MQLPLRSPPALSFERHSQSEVCVCVGAVTPCKMLTAAAAWSALEPGWQPGGGWNADGSVQIPSKSGKWRHDLEKIKEDGQDLNTARRKMNPANKSFGKFSKHVCFISSLGLD